MLGFYLLGDLFFLGTFIFAREDGWWYVPAPSSLFLAHASFSGFCLLESRSPGLPVPVSRCRVVTAPFLPLTIWMVFKVKHCNLQPQSLCPGDTAREMALGSLGGRELTVLPSRCGNRCSSRRQRRRR